MVEESRFGVEKSGIRDQGSGFSVEDSRIRIQESGHPPSKVDHIEPIPQVAPSKMKMCHPRKWLQNIVDLVRLGGRVGVEGSFLARKGVGSSTLEICSYGRPTRGTVSGTMRSMCGADAGCLAMNYHSLGNA